MEFAIIAIPFCAFLLTAMEVSYDLFVQSALDNAAAIAARLVQVGTQSGTANETGAAFVQNSVCPSLPRLLDCNRLIIAVKPIPAGQTYATAAPLTFDQAQGGSVCTGLGGQAMQMGVWYTGPSFVGSLVPAFTTLYNGTRIHLSHASAGFVNEYFGGGQSGTGC